jgi:hypothetical protein
VRRFSGEQASIKLGAAERYCFTLAGAAIYCSESHEISFAGLFSSSLLRSGGLEILQIP